MFSACSATIDDVSLLRGLIRELAEFGCEVELSIEET